MSTQRLEVSVQEAQGKALELTTDSKFTTRCDRAFRQMVATLNSTPEVKQG